MTLKSLVVIFQTLETSAASLTSLASATSLASTSSDRKSLRYQLKIGFLIIPYTKRDSYWSIWCQGWSNHQDEEKNWGNRAVEAVEASEVAEADEVNEAAEVSKGSKITTEDSSLPGSWIQLILRFWKNHDIFRLFPIISISQKFFSFFFLTLEKIGIDEKVICYHNISN